jgi:endo-1,4-beta-xylanase
LIHIDGQVYTAWNYESERLPTGGYRINGVGWNRTLAPGASTFSIGYCANN